MDNELSIIAYKGVFSAPKMLVILCTTRYCLVHKPRVLSARLKSTCRTQHQNVINDLQSSHRIKKLAGRKQRSHRAQPTHGL